MRDFLPVNVECYSGYKADESPRRFFVDGMKLEIMEIIDRWYQAGSEGNHPPADYFKVRTTDDRQFILKHEHDPDRWFLLIKGESLTPWI